jgi:hypothetical protein
MTLEWTHIMGGCSSQYGMRVDLGLRNIVTCPDCLSMLPPTNLERETVEQWLTST